jgi:hypothetical protein
MTTLARVTGLLTLIGCALLGASLPAAAATTPWSAGLTQQALNEGFLARLPPNICVVLGLAKAAEGTDVRQLLAKEGHRIRTFNVTVAGHQTVIFDVDAQTGATAAYLLTPDGKLSKAVSYKTGGQAQELSAADAKAGFAREKHFWAGRAPKASPASAAPTPPKAATAPTAPATPKAPPPPPTSPGS